MITECKSYATRYLSTFKYVRLRAEEEADLTGAIDKEYLWPGSFPECTPQLRMYTEIQSRLSYHV